MQLADDADQYLPKTDEEQPKTAPAPAAVTKPSRLEEAVELEEITLDDKRALTPSSLTDVEH